MNRRYDERMKGLSISDMIPGPEPWRPAFQTCLDFELAELMLETHMNEGQMRTLLQILNDATKQPEKLTLKTVKDVQASWEMGRKIHAQGVITSISPPHLRPNTTSIHVP